MTAEDLIKLLDRAINMLEKKNIEEEQKFREIIKHKTSLPKNDD